MRRYFECKHVKHTHSIFEEKKIALSKTADRQTKQISFQLRYNVRLNYSGLSSHSIEKKRRKKRK
jgi:hypothetical protein